MTPQSPAARRVVANLGGEEGEAAWRRAAEFAPVRAARAAFGALFSSEFQFADPFDGPASPHAEAAFEWLDDGAHSAWYDDTSPAVSEVHDKAFAVPFSGRALRDVIAVYSPDELADAERAVRDMTQQMSAWPAALRERFCLKPRLGSSGRGRVAGECASADTQAIRGALPRFAACGGAVLEPWLERSHDISVALHAAGGGAPLSLLGSLDTIATPHGVPLGHSGEIDARGRIYSRSPFDDDVRAAAAEIASDAAALGFRGPCGVDAFAYRTTDSEGQATVELRPVVEFNARFTMGIVALGALRRARAEIKDALSVAPGDRVGFVFAPSHPEGWSSARAELERSGSGAHHWSPVATCLPLDAEHGPAILAARDPAALEPVVADLRSSPSPSTESADKLAR